ncbi:MAG TPA: sulfotransferase [Chitinophagaceae bacterium]
MNRLFPLPIYTFLKIVYKNGGVATKGILNVPSWLLKTILFEPLRWIELVSQTKKINQHSIKKDPIFILGFYRSGTTFLHQLFTQDDRLGYHSVFQMVFPEIMLTSEKILSPVLEFICRVFNLQDPVHRTRLSFRFPGEEDGMMTTAVNPRGAQWGFFFPKKMNDYFRKYVLFEGITEHEKEAWKRDFVFLLKKISLASKNRQLVLKSPPNTARIKMLLSLFPNARFVLIHRNPYEVYASNKRFWKVTRDIYAIGGNKSVDTNSVILDTYAKTMDRYLTEKDLIPQGQLVEISYHDLISNPVESMRKAYETLQLDDFNHCENKVRTFAEAQKKFKVLTHELPPEERKMASEKLEPILRHWNYALQEGRA